METLNFESEPYGLAKLYELDIKMTINETLGVPIEDLELMLGDKDAVYFSKEQPNTLCCLVLGRKDGHLYLVTAEFSESDDGDAIANFKASTIS